MDRVVLSFCKKKGKRLRPPSFSQKLGPHLKLLTYNLQAYDVYLWSLIDHFSLDSFLLDFNYKHSYVSPV